MKRTSRQSPMQHKQYWYQAEEGDVHKAVFDYVRAVERAQFKTYNKLEQLEGLYDPDAPGLSVLLDGSDPCAVVMENVVASNIDTVTAVVAATDVRARFMTDGAEWGVQRRAVHLEWYAEEVSKLVDRDVKGRIGFKASAKKGTGIAKVYADVFGRVRVDPIRADDLIVDETECRNGGTPRQMHYRMTNVDRAELKAMFPEHAEAIDRAQTDRSWSRRWAGYRPLRGDDLVVIESHKLPIGVKDKKGYVPGRHTICIDGADLYDEEWEKEHFPYACIVWSEREAGFYGISLAERIAGIQRALNKRNWQIDMHIDQYAVPTTFVDMADANLTVQTINKIGTVVVHKGTPPKTIIPTAVSPEVYQNRNDMKAAAYEESGVSRLAAQAVKPAGIDSGIAMREYRDQTTQRFAMQEKAYEKFILDITWLILDVCKDLGDDAPGISYRSKFGIKQIKWADVDMQDVKVQICAASTLARTPAGRGQFVIELAQAGIISQDSATRLLRHPDLERELSLYTSALESIEGDFEAIADGATIMPEPYDNHEMIVWRGERQYNIWRKENAYEHVLEAMRNYIDLAAWYITQRTAGASNTNVDPMTMAPAAGPPLPMDPTMDPTMNPAAVGAPVPPVVGLDPAAMAS